MVKYRCKHKNCTALFSFSSSRARHHQKDHSCCTKENPCILKEKKRNQVKCRHTSCSQFLSSSHIRRHEKNNFHMNNKCPNRECLPCYKPETFKRGSQKIELPSFSSLEIHSTTKTQVSTVSLKYLTSQVNYPIYPVSREYSASIVNYPYYPVSTKYPVFIHPLI
ncbi:hypothetical protein ACTFIY_011438 [Dictyostelium cf. discoideum]